MAVYDSITFSFIRLVLFSMFECVTIWSSKASGLLDLDSIAGAIFAMDWGPYNPQNPVYMKSFLMHPVESKDEVLENLKTVHQQLQQFSNVSNQLLQVAVMTMPRTPVLRTPLLYSGQPDLPQLRARHFGAQFLEFPGNAGPPNKPLEIELEQALATFLRPGSIITTKNAWSFGDTLDIAM
ncbi:hypothetical protein RSOL_065100 [Rhizoctonia solani AG-3 Rhs1AP]|uniref:Uncharacterized protein n=2 Tax=Rhizoctonia solani AG-3 TaxID=1086053 RepID=X8IY39_9AGAM|nr:hypothetical protein RSOL_065100 [Rhizoctonia solani AG-3 Rhs1AP]